MTEGILFVDDEEYVLTALKRVFADERIPLFFAGNAREALACLEHATPAVVVSDERMPGLSGIELLSRIKTLAPDTVRILLTAHADLPTALAAINSGEVFRFVTKPWDEKELLTTVREAVARHQLLKSLRSGNEATIRSLAQTIELKDPYTRGHCDRVAGYALELAAALGFSDARQRDIRFGGWLHDCGKIGVPEEILNRPGSLDEKATAVIRRHPEWGAEVARQAGLSAGIVNIILHHHEHFNGQGYPQGLSGAAIPLEARLVAVADVYDAITTDRPYNPSHSRDEAFAILVRLAGSVLDPKLVNLFLTTQGTSLLEEMTHA